MTIVESTLDGPAGPGLGESLLSLTRREARRLARHPVVWLTPVIAVPAMGADMISAGASADYWYNVIFAIVAFLGPMVVLFAANMVASSERRVRATEMLGVTPMTDVQRTLAMCLGIALALGSVGAVGAGAMSLLDERVGDIPPEELLTTAELAQLPFILAGAGLLGVLAARWLRFPGGALVTFVVFVIGALNVFPRFDTGTWWMWWSTSATFERTPVAGDPWLHTVYLAGLCACAVVAAVFRDRTQWTKLAVVGAPVVAATLAVGWLQLP
jgi:hypothetical protein